MRNSPRVTQAPPQTQALPGQACGTSIVVSVLRITSEIVERGGDPPLASHLLIAAKALLVQRFRARHVTLFLRDAAKVVDGVRDSRRVCQFFKCSQLNQPYPIVMGSASRDLPTPTSVSRRVEDSRRLASVTS